MYEFSKGRILDGERASYRITKTIGQGGRGITYLAEVVTILDEDAAKERGLLVGHVVVIKTVALDFRRGATDVRRFCVFVDGRLVEESAALLRLRGLEFVAQFLDMGTWHAVDTQLSDLSPRFIVQEFVEGDTLYDYLKKTFPDPDNEGTFSGIKQAGPWFDLALKLTERLTAVHQRGVIHADLWSGNIIVRDTEPVYIDFGEAVFRIQQDPEAAERWYRNDVFAPPEWRKQIRRPSRRGDIYGLGTILLCAAAGIDPTPLDSDIEAAKETVVESIREKNPALLDQNPGVADIIARCLRRDREQRIPNSEALRRDISMFAQGMSRRMLNLG